MTTAIKAKKSTRKRNTKKSVATLPPSAEVVNLSGREYIIVPLDEFQEWDEDRMLSALMAERLATDEELIPMEVVEKRLTAKKKKRS